MDCTVLCLHEVFIGHLKSLIRHKGHFLDNLILQGFDIQGVCLLLQEEREQVKYMQYMIRVLKKNCQKDSKSNKQL